jgi:hypothetical protein
VQITLDGKKKRASDDKGVFTIPNIDITAGNPAEIVFSKDEYLDLAGTITQKKGALYFDGVRFGSVKYKIPQGGGVAIPDPDATYTLPDIELLPNPVPIIRGKITAIRGRDEMEQDILWDKVKIYATENGELLEVDKETEGEYTVMGYLGTEENPRDINMTFEYPGYEDKERDFEVKAKIIDKDTDIVFTVPTNASRMQENMEAMTGFGCNELMPKYLIGASCAENSELKGDASDIAFWIQKFGGKITALISFIAVLFIVFNSFKILTAVGDTDQINSGKNGLKWAIIGLFLTMFAYLVVKSVSLN